MVGSGGKGGGEKRGCKSSNICWYPGEKLTLILTDPRRKLERRTTGGGLKEEKGLTYDFLKLHLQIVFDRRPPGGNRPHEQGGLLSEVSQKKQWERKEGGEPDNMRKWPRLYGGNFPPKRKKRPKQNVQTVKKN